MYKHHKDILDRHRPELVDDIDPDLLFPELRKRKLVRLRQEDKIKRNGQRVRAEQVEDILDLIQRRGKDAFDDLCEALIASDQERIVKDYLKPKLSVATDQEPPTKKARKHNPTQNDEEDMDEGIDINDGPIPVRVNQSTEEFYQKKFKEAYPMCRSCRGLACIINVKHVIGTDDRTGTEVDCDNLQQLWTMMGFRVLVYNDEDDLSVQGIRDKVIQFAALSGHQHAQCCVLCVLSHGENGAIYGTDGKLLPVAELKYHLDSRRCRALKDKPKLIFLEACRGDLNDMDVADCPTHADFLVGFPSQPGYKAWRNRKKGSWYISAIVQVFMELAATKNIDELMTKVNSVVSRRLSRTSQYEDNNKIQMPEVRHSLRLPLYLFPGITDDDGC